MFVNIADSPPPVVLISVNIITLKISAGFKNINIERNISGRSKEEITPIEIRSCININQSQATRHPPSE